MIRRQNPLGTWRRALLLALSATAAFPATGLASVEIDVPPTGRLDQAIPVTVRASVPSNDVVSVTWHLETFAADCAPSGPAVTGNQDGYVMNRTFVGSGEVTVTSQFFPGGSGAGTYRFCAYVHSSEGPPESYDEARTFVPLPTASLSLKLPTRADEGLAFRGALQGTSEVAGQSWIFAQPVQTVCADTVAAERLQASQIGGSQTAATNIEESFRATLDAGRYLVCAYVGDGEQRAPFGTTEGAITVRASNESDPEQKVFFADLDGLKTKPGRIEITSGASFSPVFRSLGPWRAWGERKTDTKGLYRHNTCKPSCATGNIETLRVRIRLSGLETSCGGRRVYKKLTFNVRKKRVPDGTVRVGCDGVLTG